MKRREFITLLGGTAAWPLAASAQQRLLRIGYLGLTTAADARYLPNFLAGLSELGYVEAKNLQVELRFTNGDDDRLPGLAAELAGLNVDVIVAAATGVPAAYRATSTIPIVQITGGDPVAMGFAASLARPGGNVTGSTFFFAELMAKRLELLKQVVPAAARVGVLLIRDNQANGSLLEVMQATAAPLRIGLQPIEIRAPAELESAFSTWAEKQVDGLVISDHGNLLAIRDAIAALATRHHLPTVGAPELAASGALMAYGVNFGEMFHRAATFVDKIFKGSKPGDIPIERATKFQFVFNLKTAKALGLDIPPILLARADEVIE